MEKNRQTISELASLFRMLQVIPDAGGLEKIYQMLLAFCTTWRTIGFERAFLMLVDSRQRVIRGHLAARRSTVLDVAALGTDNPVSFETMAKKVFHSYEQIDSSDLTVKTRTFSLPLDWHRSALAKAVAGDYPVLAEGRVSEYATDPFLSFFGSKRYIAIPMRVGPNVTAVLAADNGDSDVAIGVEDVSLVYSLSQHASTAVGRLIESADNKRKFRILRKLQESMRSADTEEKLGGAINLALSMICRAVGGSGCFLKDFVRNKTTHIKAVDEYTVDAGDADVLIGECFDGILDRASGAMKPFHGDSGHPLLTETVSESVHHFYVCPLTVTGEGLGALAVYAEGKAVAARDECFPAKDKVFLELCAGVMAEKLGDVKKSTQLARSEDMLTELQANLAREKESTRLGQRALEYYQKMTRDLTRLKQIIFSKGPYAGRIEKAKKLLEEMQSSTKADRHELISMRRAVRMVDLGEVVREVVDQWRPEVVDNEITVQTMSEGPHLMMNRARIKKALYGILSTLAGNVTKEDKIMVECNVADDRAIVCIADTGKGMPGSLLSRLFMPFRETKEGDERKSAMSLAGDVLHHHSGEIMVKSSGAWKTVLVISFPLAANRDRRSQSQERRQRPGERRTLAGTS